MRIRRSTPSSSVSPSHTPSSCSSSSSCFSPHSTISTHSPTSTSTSTSSTTSTTTTTTTSPSRRCHGLDLLVKAVYYVAGSVVGVPYIQRRVIRRRKPALRFTNLVIHPHSLHHDHGIPASSKKPKIIKKSSKALPLKFERRVKRSIKR